MATLRGGLFFRVLYEYALMSHVISFVVTVSICYAFGYAIGYAFGYLTDELI